MRLAHDLLAAAVRHSCSLSLCRIYSTSHQVHSPHWPTSPRHWFTSQARNWRAMSSRNAPSGGRGSGGPWGSVGAVARGLMAAHARTRSSASQALSALLAGRRAIGRRRSDAAGARRPPPRCPPGRRAAGRRRGPPRSAGHRYSPSPGQRGRAPWQRTLWPPISRPGWRHWYRGPSLSWAEHSDHHSLFW